MKNRLLLLLFFLFKANIISVNAHANNGTKSLAGFQINTSDMVVFDMANALITGNYIDVPVLFSSNDTVVSLDFNLKYNKVNFVYDSIVKVNSLVKPNASANETPANGIFFSSFSNNFQRLGNNTVMLYIRFHFNNPVTCFTINRTDLIPVATYLNGDACSYQVTNPPPFRIPVADFSTASACKGNSMVFTDASRVLKDSITSWNWNFGNGSTSTSKNPNTVYTSSTTYTVTLIATSNLGCKDTVIKSFHVNATPTTNFSYAADCPSGNIVFTDLSYITAPDKIIDWSWNFGDKKQPLHTQNPQYNYDYGGSYTVTLTTLSDSGCTSTYSSKVAVTVLSAIFGATDGCKGVSQTFLDSSITAASAGAITNWKWYFGDGNTALTQAVSYAYKDTGTYVVSLKVFNANCSDSIAHTITIQDSPVVKFVQDKLSGCMPLTVNFIDSSHAPPGSVYWWYFGDNDSTLSEDATHTYLNNGNYTVKHTVITSAGCTDSVVNTSLINVFGDVVSFTASPKKVKLPEATIAFANHTKNYTYWLWNFDDSTYVSSYNAQHTFADTGSYLVCLTGKDSKGCSSYYCDSITVIAPNVVAIPYAFTPNNDNVNDVLNVRGEPVSEMEWRIFDEWGKQVFFSDQQSNGWEGTFNGTPQPAGTYEYSLKAKTVFNNETINIHGIVNLIR